MKIQTLIGVVVMFGAGLLHAATVTIDTAAFVQTAGGSRVVDNTGVVAIGTYGPTDPTLGANFTKAEVITGFTQLGQETFKDSIGNLDGFFRFDLTADITNSFNGLPVYLVLGNQSSLAASTEFLVWKATSNPDGSSFVEDNPLGGPGSVTLDNTTGSLFAGTFGGGEFHLELAQVPEPSSTALLGLGGVALLLRRRR